MYKMTKITNEDRAVLRHHYQNLMNDLPLLIQYAGSKGRDIGLEEAYLLAKQRLEELKDR